MFLSQRNFTKPTELIKKSGGFTIVELLVTISIFVVLTGIVLFNQSKFNSTILLTNLAYDTALTIRLAQNYGLNIRESDNTSIVDPKYKFLPYGVHFETEANNKSFLLFADLTYNGEADPGYGVFPTDADSSTCDAVDGCVNRYSIRRGNIIKYICAEALAMGTSTCTGTPLPSIDITFIRPNPDAYIRYASGSSDPVQYKVVTIVIGGADGSTRKVIVRSNGLIEVVP